MVGAATRARALVLLGCLGLVACSGFQPTEYDPDHRNNPAMPGILTGKEGEFVIYRRQDAKSQPSSTEADANEQDDVKQPRE